jgi:hypothetical protein
MFSMGVGPRPLSAGIVWGMEKEIGRADFKEQGKFTGIAEIRGSGKKDTISI